MSGLKPKIHQELLLERTYPAPPEAVFDAWAADGQLSQWFRPNGLTCPRFSLDPQPGGAVGMLLQSPDGQSYDCGGSTVLFERPRRLVFQTRVPDGTEPPALMMLHTLDFREADGGTALAWLTQVIGLENGVWEISEQHDQVCRSLMDMLEQFLTDRSANI